MYSCTNNNEKSSWHNHALPNNFQKNMSSPVSNAYLLIKLTKNDWFRLQMSVKAQLSTTTFHSFKGLSLPLTLTLTQRRHEHQKIELVGIGENAWVTKVYFILYYPCFKKMKICPNWQISPSKFQLTISSINVSNSINTISHYQNYPIISHKLCHLC